MKRMVLILTLLFPLISHAGESLHIADLMTHREYKEAGLDKLSAEEVAALNRWLTEFAKEKGAPHREGGEIGQKPEKKGLKNIFGGGGKRYRIQHASGGTSFEINNRKFEASGKCPSFKKGDDVEFIEGSAYGLCTTAVFKKPGSDETCKVWCEEQ